VSAPANPDALRVATTTLAWRMRQALQTERLEIEPICGEFAERSFALYNDPALYQWISLKHPASVESLRADWRRLETPVSPDGSEAWLCWQLRCKATGRVIGMLDADVMQHLLTYGIHTLFATVTVGNVASKNLLEKLGFVYHQLLKDNDTLRGELVDDWEFVYRRPRA